MRLVPSLSKDKIKCSYQFGCKMLLIRKYIRRERRWGLLESSLGQISTLLFAGWSWANHLISLIPDFLNDQCQSEMMTIPSEWWRGFSEMTFVKGNMGHSTGDSLPCENTGRPDGRRTSEELLLRWRKIQETPTCLSWFVLRQNLLLEGVVRMSLKLWCTQFVENSN